MAANADEKPGSKQIYTRSLQTNLMRKKEQLASIKRRVRQARKAGRIGISEQLRNAEQHADSTLATAEVKFQQLNDAAEESWQELQSDVDQAWEDFSHSVKALVARFS